MHCVMGGKVEITGDIFEVWCAAKLWQLLLHCDIHYGFLTELLNIFPTSRTQRNQPLQHLHHSIKIIPLALRER